MYNDRGLPMTDRDAINAVFHAVCALAEKLTGEKLIFEMRLEKNRGIVWVTSEHDQIVDWLKLPPKETADPALTISANNP